jgi:hypothetical protein
VLGVDTNDLVITMPTYTPLLPSELLLVMMCHNLGAGIPADITYPSGITKIGSNTVGILSPWHGASIGSKKLDGQARKVQSFPDGSYASVAARDLVYVIGIGKPLAVSMWDGVVERPVTLSKWNGVSEIALPDLEKI